ncbi:hypothetical protein GCM10007140_29460 [Priestia taiwanensis]|uniref:Uncharacterized protein n=2 Tax=Priestia taiwanensis TaxID=1347902 RepID=A0A917AV08_9BACI|nr:hypothetical protein GCM10007140_29460 [Priestia taiwanensis]
MEYEYLRYDGVNGLGKHLLFTDTRYDILIAHHYPLDCLQYDYLPDYQTYCDVQKKYNRRIKRLYEHMEECNSILFIREGGNLEEIEELHALLSKLVKGRFVLVVVNWIQSDAIYEERTSLENVCFLSFDLLNIERWKEVLDGVSLKE